MREPKGRYSRGYIPHIDAGAAYQFITFRLVDSLPSALFKKWRYELRLTEETERKQELYRRVETYLDTHRGSCVLGNPNASHVFIDHLKTVHGQLCNVDAFVVMPNHVHLLVAIYPEIPIGKLVKDVKGPSAQYINKAIGRTGTLWQPDYFDRLIRTDEHREKVAKYIEWNPVKAKLATDPKEWAASSASQNAKNWLIENRRVFDNSETTE